MRLEAEDMPIGVFLAVVDPLDFAACRRANDAGPERERVCVALSNAHLPRPGEAFEERTRRGCSDGSASYATEHEELGDVHHARVFRDARSALGEREPREHAIDTDEEGMVIRRGPPALVDLNIEQAIVPHHERHVLTEIVRVELKEPTQNVRVGGRDGLQEDDAFARLVHEVRLPHYVA